MMEIYSTRHVGGQRRKKEEKEEEKEKALNVFWRFSTI